MRICIDSGHNNSDFDTGAVGNGLREQDITFGIGSKLAALLWQKGYEVVETRLNKATNLGSDLNSSISKRIEICNSNDCDLFVSIHCNAGGGNGTETFVVSKTGKAYKLAKSVNDSIVKNMKLGNRGVKKANYGVLVYTDPPAILVETAFIDNKSDSVLLLNKQDEFAQAIYSGIMQYLGVNEEIIEAVTEEVPETIYKTIGDTKIIEIDPRNIFSVVTKKKTYKTEQANFVNGIYFINQAVGGPAPNGIMVNAGVVLANNATHGLPVSTLIIRGPSDVKIKQILDITQEPNVWFAISGFGLYPQITAEEEGFEGKFADVLRAAHRPIIGYRKSDNKVVIAVRAFTTAQRAHETARNLGLDCAISLDGGGSTTLKINNKFLYDGDGRELFGGLTWR